MGVDEKRNEIKAISKEVIILLGEYDTPMQEAYVNGFWEELVTFTRSMFNSTFILEFKVQNSKKEKELADAVQAALDQIKEKIYEAMLVERGVPREKIRKYGFAFSRRKVLIGAD